MDSDDSWLALGLLFFLFLGALVSAVEAGVGGLTNQKMTNQDAKNPPRGQASFGNPRYVKAFLSVIQTVAIFGFAALATFLGVRSFSPNWGAVAGVALASLLALLGLQMFIRGVTAARRARIGHLLGSGIEGLEPAQGVAEEGVGIREKPAIWGALGLRETMVREIMVPRIDIVAADAETPLPKVVDLILERGYSRIPIFEDTIDNIIGIIYAKDLMRLLKEGDCQADLKEIARPPHFIPESKRIGELLQEFQQERVHMAIVIDEYGGTAGLVTIEDLLEEIVGEIEDEYDRGEAPIEWLSDTEAIMFAKVGLDDLNQMFGLSLQGEGFDTVGGFVYSQLGKIPTVGDEITANGITISVLSTIGRRIHKVKVTKL